MLNRIIDFSLHQRWFVLRRRGAARGDRRSTTISACRSTPCRTSPTFRCRSTPKRPGSRRWKPSSAITFPDRDGAGRPAAAGVHALAVALRSVAGDRRVSGRHGYLFRAPARRGATGRSALAAAAGIRARAGSDRHGARRNLHVHGRPRMQGTQLDADRPAHRAGLDHSSAAAADARRRRSEHDRRLREGVHRRASIPSGCSRTT